jgi:hypothetical protein
MRKLTLFKYFTVLIAFGLIIAAHMDWVIIRSVNITISGMETEGTSYGQPGMMHLVMGILYVIFALIPRLWAKRLNLLVGALNIAWAVRNYLLVSACSGGECPEKQLGLYLVLICSAILMAGALFPDLQLNQVRKREGSR